MWILYDFETSSRYFIGQIISYSFWVVDSKWQPIEKLNGFIRLKPTELPELDAILITKTHISTLQKEGDSEEAAAKLIHQFLGKCVSLYGHCVLAGYNSSRFDLKFLRTTLIRYGLNPYFMGKLTSIDILHYVYHVALANPDQFPWQNNEDGYWTFSLESVAKSHSIIDQPQAHEAEADVMIMRDLIMELEARYQDPLTEFRPVRLPYNARCEPQHILFRQMTRGTPPEKVTLKIWYRLFYSKSDLIVLDVEQFMSTPPKTTDELISLLRYINCNTQYFSTEPLPFDKKNELNPLCVHIDELIDSLGFTRDRYFEITKKDWDIEFQIHAMGFERIDTLRHLIQTIETTPSRYAEIVAAYWSHHRDEKDRLLIQLLNRWALNTLPHLPLTLTDRYIIPRYINHTLYPNHADIESIEIQIERAKSLLETSTNDSAVITDYLNYATDFLSRYELNRFVKTTV